MIARIKPPLFRFIDFIVEREAIRLKREKGMPAPWTDDPILQMYRFTNIRRKHDRVSMWFDDCVYCRLGFDQPTLQAIQFAALCRWVNWPPTIAAMILEGLWPSDNLDLREIGNLIDARKKGGDKAWTGAYMVRAQPGLKIGKGRFVAEQVCGRSLRRAWPELQFALETNMRRPVWKVLIDCLHWGSFMAGQVVDDLTWTPLLKEPRDDLTWAPFGPGSIRGLNRVFGLPLKTKHDEYEWCRLLRSLRVALIDARGQMYNDMTLMDIQNCLCEFDKWERVRLAQGRPRSLYKSEEAY